MYDAAGSVSAASTASAAANTAAARAPAAAAAAPGDARHLAVFVTTPAAEFVSELSTGHFS